MIHPHTNTTLLNESISMSFKAAIDRYDLGHFPDYILEKYANELVYVFENEVYTSSLEMDVTFMTEPYYGAIFLKNLHAEEYIIQEETDYGPLIIVQGDIEAKNLFVSGGDCYFRGNVNVAQTLVAGVYNHGELTINGQIEADLILSFDHSFTYSAAHIKRGIVVGLQPSFEHPEFQSYDFRDVLEKKYYLPGEEILNTDQVLKAMRKGQTLLKNTTLLTPLERQILKARQSNAAKANLGGMSLKDIPQALFELADLTALDLSCNYLESLPAKFLQFKQLSKINLFDCEFEAFPEVLLQMPSLQEINLGKNSLSRLPDGLVNLSNLKKMGLYRCNLSEFPEQLYHLDKLEEIDLSYQEEQPALIINQPLHALKTLHLNANFGTSIQVALPNLQELSMRNCSVKEFPTSILSSKKLKKLDLSLTRGMLDFPATIENLQQLREFRFTMNDHKPANFDQLNKLPKLHKLWVQLPFGPPHWFLDILQIEHWTELYVEGKLDNPAIWREILKRKKLTKLAKVSQFGEEVLNIEQGRKELKAYPDAK
ncbi:MAG TPA: leucine-rich repeat domain-containing protein [Haliscomenobacter sp.]|uniref:leucine-rich repeat domain-containing protein n=1 Tax=Haliscomenobacter sp. TaxID=2717303 RepID=UPI002C6A5281|nr:leucine-rich repeat domain-containing protein [Haliscomenobacter sp.]HOY19110.1 leucine-rich repeat domain-containing protein [Haliscomenobacter sp.]